MTTNNPMLLSDSVFLDVRKHTIRSQYDEAASWYDVVEGSSNRLLGISAARRRLLRLARGDVLEVAMGTGPTIPDYPQDTVLTGVDLSPRMLDRAEDRARRVGRDVDLHVMDAEALGFRDGAFDTVVSSLSLCTYPAPAATLRELARVCDPGGRLLLLEHGRSDRPWLARWQDRRADAHGRQLSCRWNRDVLGLVREAGLRVRFAERFLLGTVHVIVAQPTDAHVSPGR